MPPRRTEEIEPREKLGARRAVLRTVPEILAYVETQLSNLTDAYTVLLTVDGVPAAATQLHAIAQPGARVTVITEHNLDKTQRREDPFIVRGEDAPTKEGEIAAILRELREDKKDARQTIADLHTIIRQTSRSVMKQTKTVGKFVKRVGKALDKQHRLKQQLQALEDNRKKGILAELREELGDELTAKVIGKLVGSGFDIFGSKGSSSADSGGTKTVSAEPVEGSDRGENGQE